VSVSENGIKGAKSHGLVPGGLERVRYAGTIVSQTARSDDAIRVALLLKPERRSSAGRESTVLAAANLGLEETSRGSATISFRVSRARFATIFSAEAHPEIETTIPEPLADYVDAVSVEPPVVRMEEAEVD
jgi:hypothetical protein